MEEPQEKQEPQVKRTPGRPISKNIKAMNKEEKQQFLREYMNQYNAKTGNESFFCECCGFSVKKKSLYKHKKSEGHIKNLNGPKYVKPNENENFATLGETEKKIISVQPEDFDLFNKIINSGMLEILKSMIIVN